MRAPAAAHERPNTATELILVVLILALNGAARARVRRRRAAATVDVDEGNSGREAGTGLLRGVARVRALTRHCGVVFDVVVYIINRVCGGFATVGGGGRELRGLFGRCWELDRARDVAQVVECRAESLGRVACKRAGVEAVHCVRCMAEKGAEDMAERAVIANAGGCTILCLPVAWALARALRQEKWVHQRVSFVHH
ncbi:hypothetical protein OPT61_g301 [Boeremia exigua]|uniref:Uncharacterized protein n=1 Tax=Boeremia exigua TaxID=749465 RepID=A0ACC2IUE0_9PLEO|nr:hypothetical protein OPT61_g301 [Boeremia exigua]